MLILLAIWRCANRQAWLTSGDGNWIGTPPNSIEWDEISANAEAIAGAVGLDPGVNPIEDEYTVAIDNRIEVYTLTTLTREEELKYLSKGPTRTAQQQQWQ